MRIVAPQGGLPTDPQELKELLEDNLNSVIRNLIHIIVIDVTLQQSE